MQGKYSHNKEILFKSRKSGLSFVAEMLRKKYIKDGEKSMQGICPSCEMVYYGFWEDHQKDQQYCICGEKLEISQIEDAT